MKAFKSILFMGIIVVFASACADSPKWQKGAVIGGAAGAGAGAIIGHQSGHKGEGALIGAAAGAALGGLIGAKLDKQQAELSKIAEVERPSENELIVTLREKVLFDVNKYSLKPGAEANLSRVADVLARYPDFNIDVEGHTDNTGQETYNQWLSEKRAGTVADFIVTEGVHPDRIMVIGYGETQPVTTNETAEGRQQNRRVELHIVPREI